MILILKSKFYKRNYITPTKVYGNSFNKLYEKSIYPIGKKNTHTQTRSRLNVSLSQLFNYHKKGQNIEVNVIRPTFTPRHKKIFGKCMIIK
jgi:hypothetical protein